MRLDVSPRAGPGVRPQFVKSGDHEPHQEVALQHLVQPVQISRKGQQQGRKVRAVPLAGHIAFAKADEASGKDAVEELVVLYRHPGRRAFLHTGKADFAAAGQHKGQGARAPVFLEDPLDQAKAARERQSVGRHAHLATHLATKNPAVQPRALAKAPQAMSEAP